MFGFGVVQLQYSTAYGAANEFQSSLHRDFFNIVESSETKSESGLVCDVRRNVHSLSNLLDSSDGKGVVGCWFAMDGSNHSCLGSLLWTSGSLVDQDPEDSMERGK